MEARLHSSTEASLKSLSNEDGDGNENGYGNEDGDGNENGYGNENGDGNENGYGNEDGDGNENGYGNENGDGNENGYGNENGKKSNGLGLAKQQLCTCTTLFVHFLAVTARLRRENV